MPEVCEKCGQEGFCDCYCPDCDNVWDECTCEVCDDCGFYIGECICYCPDCGNHYENCDCDCDD